MSKSYINIYIYTPVFPKPLTALEKENFVVNPVSNSAISLCASSTEFTYPKLSACLPSMVRDLKFSLCCFCLFLKNHGIYSFGCSATSLADFRESSVMFCKSLNSQLSPSRPRWFWWMESNADLFPLWFSHDKEVCLGCDSQSRSLYQEKSKKEVFPLI